MEKVCWNCMRVGGKFKDKKSILLLFKNNLVARRRKEADYWMNDNAAIHISKIFIKYWWNFNKNRWTSKGGY